MAFAFPIQLPLCLSTNFLVSALPILSLVLLVGGWARSCRAFGWWLRLNHDMRKGWGCWACSAWRRDKREDLISPQLSEERVSKGQSLGLLTGFKHQDKSQQAENNAQKVLPEYKEELFYCAGDQALEEVALRDYRVTIWMQSFVMYFRMTLFNQGYWTRWPTAVPFKLSALWYNLYNYFSKSTN